MTLWFRMLTSLPEQQDSSFCIHKLLSINLEQGLPHVTSSCWFLRWVFHRCTRQGIRASKKLGLGQGLSWQNLVLTSDRFGGSTHTWVVIVGNTLDLFWQSNFDVWGIWREAVESSSWGMTSSVWDGSQWQAKESSWSCCSLWALLAGHFLPLSIPVCITTLVNFWKGKRFPVQCEILTRAILFLGTGNSPEE